VTAARTASSGGGRRLISPELLKIEHPGVIFDALWPWS
jgi:hypothetical protein